MAATAETAETTAGTTTMAEAEIGAPPLHGRPPPVTSGMATTRHTGLTRALAPR